MCQGRKPSVLSTGPNFNTKSGSGKPFEPWKEKKWHMKLTYIAYQKMIYGKICSSNWFLMFSCICSLQKLYSHVPYPNFLAKHILLYLLFPNVDIFSKGCLTGLITWQGGVSQLPPTLQVVPKSHLSFKTQLVFSRHPKTCTVLRTQILILATEPSNFRDEKQLYKLSILLPFPCADFTV